MIKKYAKSLLIQTYLDSMFNIKLLTEDLAGLVPQLPDEDGQGVLVHIHQVRKRTNFGENFC